MILIPLSLNMFLHLQGLSCPTATDVAAGDSLSETYEEVTLLVTAAPGTTVPSRHFTFAINEFVQEHIGYEGMYGAGLDKEMFFFVWEYFAHEPVCPHLTWNEMLQGANTSNEKTFADDVTEFVVPADKVWHFKQNYSYKGATQEYLIKPLFTLPRRAISRIGLKLEKFLWISEFEDAISGTGGGG